MNGADGPDVEERPVRVSADRVGLEGNLAVPGSALGVVLFAHGSGSGRHSPRNRYVARALREAALVAAAEHPKPVGAIVSRGGRPDLAGPALPRVAAPTLLIVGGNDFPVIDMNRDALEQMSTEKRLEIVPGATHLFEEPGALEQVARLAAGWCVRHLDPEVGIG